MIQATSKLNAISCTVLRDGKLVCYASGCHCTFLHCSTQVLNLLQNNQLHCNGTQLMLSFVFLQYVCVGVGVAVSVYDDAYKQQDTFISFPSGFTKYFYVSIYLSIYQI